MSYAIYTFFMAIGTGLAGSLSVVPVRQIGRLYVRFMLILGLFFCGAGIWAGQVASQISGQASSLYIYTEGIDATLRTAWILLVIMALLLLLSPFHERNFYQRFLYAQTGLFAIWLTFTGFTLSPFGYTEGTLNALALLTTSALLATGIGTMILGHWYLVVPGLSLAPLHKMTRYLKFSTIGKTVVIVLSLGHFLYHPIIWNFSRRLFLTNGLWFGSRLVFGIAGSYAVVWMLGKILAIRNTQAATGILYVASIWLLLSEFFARMLWVECGWPS